MPERGTSALAITSVASRRLRRPTPALRASPFVPATQDSCVIVGVRTCLGRVYSPQIRSASKPKRLIFTGGVGDALNVLVQTRRHLGGFDRLLPRSRRGARRIGPRLLRAAGRRRRRVRPVGGGGRRQGPRYALGIVATPVAGRRDRNRRDRRNSSYMTVRTARSASMPLRRAGFSISNRVRPRPIAAPPDRPRPLPHKA